MNNENVNNTKNEQITALENFVKQHMTKQAISRYGNIKLAHPELALNALALLFQAVQQGITIDDDALKQMLKSIQINNVNKHQFSIK